jgi:antitoxin FitA
VHRKLKARAASGGVSLSEYLRTELERVAASPTPDELLDRLRSRKAVRPREGSADALRAVRDVVWAMRRTLSAYDAQYVALAKALQRTLLTTDRRMANTARQLRVAVA